MSNAFILALLPVNFAHMVLPTMAMATLVAGLQFQIQMGFTTGANVLKQTVITSLAIRLSH
tara:strand:+ start:240 stop:422 length:183 start_codon:yes stop_codon:yes gene_type:complete